VEWLPHHHYSLIIINYSLDPRSRRRKSKVKVKVKSGMVDIPIYALTRDHETLTQLPRCYTA
jgi:hypothetical protein